MPLTWRRRLLSVLPRLGLTSEPLGRGAAVVAKQGERLSVRAVDDRTWVVQHGTGRRRRLRRMGAPRLRTHLLVDEKAARKDLLNQQMHLLRYVGAEHTAEILRQLEVDCVLDVGANVGQFGKSLRDAGYDGRIVSFEPLPHLAERLDEHADRDPNWHVMRYALGDEDTEAEMTVVAGRGSTSSLLPVSEFGASWSSRLSGVDTQSVPVRRLDGVLDEALAGLDEPRVFLKMDTQGYDLRTFAGAGDRIADIVGLQSEIAALPIYDHAPLMHEALATYTAAGFDPTGIFPVSRDKGTPRIIEFDVVMVRPEAFATA